MVSSSIMASPSAPNEKYRVSTSTLHEELNIARAMKNSSIIEHENEPNNYENYHILNVFSPIEKETHTDMIHIDVPDTKTLVEKSDGVSKYVGYNIHINGWYHSCVRFSHLYGFAEFIKQKFGQQYKGPEFPSKKIFKLDSKAIEERRLKILKYFQALVQHSEIARNYTIEKHLLGFQIDSYRATSNFVSLDVFLPDGEKVILKCTVSDSTSDIMKAIAERVGFNNLDQFSWNFGLFMAKPRDPSVATYSINPENFDPLIVRFLRNFEAPYISLSTTNHKMGGDGIFHFLCIRKLIWDPRIEEPLLDHSACLDMLYRQALHDFKLGHFGELKNDQINKLKLLSQREDKTMFLRACHLLPMYSYEILANCTSDYPTEGNNCSVKFGRRQFILSYNNESGETINSIFRATRIRVWRITQVLDHLSFQFEYLIARDNFEWITLHTNQAVLMSLLLQSIGAEILSEHRNMSLEEQIMKEKHSKGIYVDKDERNTRDPNKPIIILKNAVEPSDPLGVMEHYRSYNEMFTIISDSIPQHNDAVSNISNEDL